MLQIENYNKPFLDALAQYDDGRDLSDYDFNKDELGAPQDDANKRKLAYRHRVIAEKYIQVKLLEHYYFCIQLLKLSTIVWNFVLCVIIMLHIYWWFLKLMYIIYVCIWQYFPLYFQFSFLSWWNGSQLWSHSIVLILWTMPINNSFHNTLSITYKIKERMIEFTFYACML